MKPLLLLVLLGIAIQAALAQPIIQVAAGRSGSNAFVGGKIFQEAGTYTNLNGTGTLTNLLGCIIASNTLIYPGHSFTARWGGKLANATANTNRFAVGFGSTFVLDTGLQTASNTAWHCTITITSISETQQQVEGYFDWAGSGVPFIRTNINLLINETNSVNTRLQLRGGARIGGAHTNNSFHVFFEPAVR